MIPFIPASLPFAPSILQTNEIPTAHAARGRASSIINGRCFVLFNAMVLISLFSRDTLFLLLSSVSLFPPPFFDLPPTHFFPSQERCTDAAAFATRCFAHPGSGESGRHKGPCTARAPSWERVSLARK